MINFIHKNESSSIIKINKYICYIFYKKLFFIYIILKFILLLTIIILIINCKKLNNNYKKIPSFNLLYQSNIKIKDNLYSYNNKSLKDIEYENENFFFMKKKGKLNYCKNIGIFIYNYPFMQKPKYGNIGDYIQSLAALQYFPKNCIPFFVDRDNVEFFNESKSNIIIIMNGWNRIRKGNRKISDKIIPIYVSYHINNKKSIDRFSINNLKKYEPIGCRDISTQKLLEKNGINAYFSSCLTTTLDIDFAVNDTERTNEIIFIDYRFGRFPKADTFIKSLKKYNFSNIVYKKHMYNLKLSHFERFKLAKQLLDQYARAKLVISTRIHGALPCLALNTPVIFINRKFDRRYPGLYELLNTIGINSKGKFEIKVELNNNLVINPKKYLEYSNKLKKTIKEYIK